ncbi:MAG: hypothetical protein ACLPV8_25485 [Steroidobacteraceae bacterium]
MARDSTRPFKSLEQLVAEHPHIQFFRDMLGMQQDAREREAERERHWLSLLKSLQLVILPGASKPPTRTQKLVAGARRVLARLRSLPLAR